MFEGFKLSMVDTGEARLRVRHGGNGPPLVLLHGHPQTHVMWHAVAPRLADTFTVVCCDLRGYGDSSKPPTTPDHEPYSKRAMARDVICLMEQFGFDRFGVCGHDRGGRVAYRLALDHPEQVTKLAVLDIIPTLEVWRRFDREVALGFWHWTFLAQAELPERLLTTDPEAYYFRSGRERFHEEALAEYLRCVRDPQTIHAMCEDYRAGATYDVDVDTRDAGVRRIGCPVRVLWSAQDCIEKWDMLDIWRGWADDVSGRAIECGHYLAEERPDETYSELHTFFAE